MGGSCSSNRESSSNSLKATSPNSAPVSNQLSDLGSTFDAVTLVGLLYYSSGGIFVSSGPWSLGSPKAILN
jgi:hypothetical protein